MARTALQGLRRRLAIKAGDWLERSLSTAFATAGSGKMTFLKRMTIKAGRKRYNLYYFPDRKEGVFNVSRISRGFFHPPGGPISSPSSFLGPIESYARKRHFKKISIDSTPEIGRILAKNGYSYVGGYEDVSVFEKEL